MKVLRKPRTPKDASAIDQNSSAWIIINDKFGGLARYCAFSGDPTSTVWGWLQRGYIPPLKQPRVLELAKKHKIDVKPADFIPRQATVEKHEADTTGGAQ
jgi:hypothetical protein